MMVVGVFKLGETLFESNDVNCITVPSVNGQMSVYPNHIASVISLSLGEVIIRYNEFREEKVKKFRVSDGIFSILGNRGEVVIFLD